MIEVTKNIPSETELKKTLQESLKENPDAGFKKLFEQLKISNPSWQVSEKRTHKVVQELRRSHELRKLSPTDAPVIPVADISTNNNELFNKNCELKAIPEIGGKGCFAKRDIKEGEVLFEEKCICIAEYATSNYTRPCSHCYKSIPETSTAVAVCKRCKVVYCTKECRDMDWLYYHEIECPALNPAYKSFMDLWKIKKGYAPIGGARFLIRMILLSKHKPEEFDDFYRWYLSAAKDSREAGGPSFDQKVSFNLFSKAISKYTADFPIDNFFTIESYMLACSKFRMNNQEGAVFMLHSTMNHSCVPNVALRNMIEYNRYYQIKLLAARDLKEGEQLFQNYFGSPKPFIERSRKAMIYGFKCQCSLCETERKEAIESFGSEEKLDMFIRTGKVD